MLSFLLALSMQDSQMLPVGKLISPLGSHSEVGSYPINSVSTLDRKFAVISTMGFRQFLSVIEISTGKVKSQLSFGSKQKNPEKDGLYFGLAVHPKMGHVFASRGAQDRVSEYSISPDGQIEEVGTPILEKEKDPSRQGLPLHFCGLSFNSNGSRLAVVNNQTSLLTQNKGSVTVYENNARLFNVPTSGFPYDIKYKSIGKEADRKVYVSCERNGLVEVIDVESRSVSKQIRTGAGTANLLFSSDQTRLYAANTASDTISVINTETDKVVDTLSVRPPELRGLPGATPLGMSLADGDKTLYVALGDMQCVAKIDLVKKRVVGYVPTGWLPTSIVSQGSDLLITSAKGIQAMNPNGKPVGDKGTYIQDIIAGTVTHIKTPTAAELEKMTVKVIANNRISKGLDRSRVANFKNPGVKYVIYVIKENRTYDNVLGDLKQGNGDPSLTLFPREVTPNQHALAERFVLLDNFYVCAEVSQDGWQWSLSGMASAYGSRNTPYNYSGRGRSYDTEGSNNGDPVGLLGLKNVAEPASTYIWDHLNKHKVSYRNYGMFATVLDAEDKRNSSLEDAKDSYPLIKSLIGKTNTNFRHYDLRYADSPIYDEYNFELKNRLKTYGDYKSTNRFSEWKREFDQFVKEGKMPRFQTIRFGNDHTSGTQNNQPTAKSMVADNDYAVGKLVEAVSNSPFWKETAICILEDDAQNGIDHVDAHRSTAYVISPYIQKGTVDSTFYNTDSMLRSMQLLLGVPPMSQYDAVATPFQFFGASAANLEPYVAIKPSRDIVCNVNTRSAYRSKASERIPRFAEDSELDEQLNDILWKSIKGANSPTPKPRYGLISKHRKKD